MNQYPFIPPLEPKQVKELLRQIRVMRWDYPHLSDEELAEEWAERQRWNAQEGKPSPYITWIEGDRWLQGWRKAADFAARQTQQKQRAKAQRKAWKEVLQDKQPATPRQVRYVKRLAEKAHTTLQVPADQLSKLQASRLIKKFLDESSS
jgi:hypothetical protein